jgi:HPt (histidine-containing phosphotransfer) domain-containing protein
MSTANDAAPDPPILERAALDKVLQLGGPTLLRRLIDMFLENAPARLERARDAERSGALRDLEQATHSLKSTAGNLGARRLQLLSERIEGLAADGSADGVRPLMTQLDEAYTAAREALLQERETLAS